MVEIKGVIVGSVLLGFGLLGMRHAYGITRFEERLDAIGSTQRTGSIEPAEWNVTFTKALSGCLAIIGVMILLLAVLE